MSLTKWIITSGVFQFRYLSSCVDVWHTQPQNRPQALPQPLMSALQMGSLSAQQPLLQAVQRLWTPLVSAPPRRSLWTPQRPSRWPCQKLLLWSLKSPLRPPPNLWWLQRVTYTCLLWFFMNWKSPAFYWNIQSQLSILDISNKIIHHKHF